MPRSKPKPSGLQVETWPIDKLVEYERNPRKNDHAVDAVAKAIGEFGFRVPVIAKSDGSLVDGHLRLKAARQLGLKEVPVVLADDLTDAQIKAFRLSVNKVAELADWDMDLLAVELGEIQALDFDLDVIGFDVGEVADILADRTEGETDPDEVPEVQEQAVTVKGDTWLLGRHRLRCGDSTSAEDVAALLGEVKPHLMVTDPPYGVNYDAGWRSSLDCIDRATGLVQNDNRADWSEAYALFPGEVAYVWHADRMGVGVGVGVNLMTLGFELRALIIWVKPHFSIGRGDYHVQHEPCWYAVRGKGQWQGSRKESTVWQIKNATFQGGKQGPENAKTGHGTQKPIECMRRPIVNNSSPGQAVYEPFCGSGTTIIAGEMEGRHIYAMELDERYCDVIVKRWQEFTGQTATLEGDGRTFEEISAERAKETVG